MAELRGEGSGARRPNRATELLRLNDTRWDGWIETIAVLLLAIASLTAAWSGYQAAKWGGEQSNLFSQASALRVQATEASTSAYLALILDIETFNNFANAYALGDEELMAFHERQFSERLAPAAEAWIALAPLQNVDAPTSPFAMPEYIVPERERANRLEAEAEALYERGLHANEQSDGYVLNTVFLATVLFFAGIVTKILRRPGRLLLEVLGVGLLLFGIYHVATLPIE